MSAQRAICYLRVSTARQGASGLGLEAQLVAVRAWAATTGHELVGEFVEIESGKRNDRPELAAALMACRLHRATLVIAKLDRLARNVAFIANLMDGGVDFVACDVPHASRLTLHIMAAMAEYEREQISHRTKAALAAAKARGVRLGSPRGAAHLHATCRVAAAASAAARRKVSAVRAAAILPVLHTVAAEGASGLRGFAKALNQRGIPTARGATRASIRMRSMAV